jgi:short-subunit dehydrogenase
MTSYALVTGGTSGIGKAFCFALAEKGYNLIIVSNNTEHLRAVQTELERKFETVRIVTKQCDLRNLKNVYELSEFCIKSQLEINILINNAGLCIWSRFDESDLNSQLEMLQLNIASSLVLIHTLMPVLEARPKSYILNVSSTTAFQPIPYINLYSCSKTFMRNFTKSLKYEMRNKKNINISCLTPGSTDTNFSERTGFSERIIKMGNSFSMPADIVAKKGLDGLFANKAEIIPGFINKLSSFLVRLIPDSYLIKMGASIYKK